MNCPVCGNEMPEGVTQCSACGYSADAAQPVQQMQPMQPMQQAGFNNEEPAKSKKGLMIGIIIGAVVLIAAIAVILIVFVFGKSKLEGTYKCDDYEDFGLTMELELDDGKCEVVVTGWGESDTQEGTYTVDGDTVTMVFPDETMVGEFDSKEGTLTIDGLVFEK